MKLQTTATMAIALGCAIVHAAPECTQRVQLEFMQLFIQPDMLTCVEESGVKEDLESQTKPSYDQRMKALRKLCTSKECKPLITRIAAFGNKLNSDCEVGGHSLKKGIDEFTNCSTDKAAKSGAVHVTTNVQMLMVVAGVTLGTFFGW